VTMLAMLSNRTISRKTLARGVLLIGVSMQLMSGGPALAQSTVESRVNRLEQEMRAVQRKVFPGGAGQVLTPEVTPQAPVPGTAAGSPATAPIADLTARITSIEAQLARLTGQIEENEYRVRQLEETYKKLAAAQAEPAAPAQSASSPFGAPSAPLTAQERGAVANPTPVANAGGGATLARTEAVAAVERPSTGNAASDSYTYGYRLWTAKFYPEAQVQLQDTVNKYGKDPIASRAHNLLGRAFLDDNKPAAAAKIFYANYRERPKGDRAAESLAWVGESLIKLNRLKDACLAYDELSEVFGSTMQASVRAMMTNGRTRAKCSG
jgi:TolA-binding protein